MKNKWEKFFEITEQQRKIQNAIDTLIVKLQAGDVPAEMQQHVDETLLMMRNFSNLNESQKQKLNQLIIKLGGEQ